MTNNSEPLNDIIIGVLMRRHEHLQSLMTEAETALAGINSTSLSRYKAAIQEKMRAVEAELDKYGAKLEGED